MQVRAKLKPCPTWCLEDWNSWTLNKVQLTNSAHTKLRVRGHVSHVRNSLLNEVRWKENLYTKWRAWLFILASLRASLSEPTFTIHVERALQKHTFWSYILTVEVYRRHPAFQIWSWIINSIKQGMSNNTWMVCQTDREHVRCRGFRIENFSYEIFVPG